MITDKLINEIIFQTARSGGKGGQNVNKVSTKVELYFDIFNSSCISYEDKIALADKLANRMDKNGVLKLSAQTERSQYQNKLIVIEKFKNLLKEALKKPKKRLKTKPTANSKEKRISSKKIISSKKTMRKKDLNFSDE